MVRARPLVFIVTDDSPRGRSIYVAGGFNVNPSTHRSYIVPDLQLFEEKAQRWQQLTIIPHLELKHALSFNDNRLHINETAELPNQLPITTILRSFDLGKLIWIDANAESDPGHPHRLR